MREENPTPTQNHPDPELSNVLECFIEATRLMLSNEGIEPDLKPKVDILRGALLLSWMYRPECIVLDKLRTINPKIGAAMINEGISFEDFSRGNESASETDGE